MIGLRFPGSVRGCWFPREGEEAGLQSVLGSEVEQPLAQ